MANNISLECLESNLSLKSGEIMIFFPLLAIFRSLSLLLSNTRIKIQKK